MTSASRPAPWNLDYAGGFAYTTPNLHVHLMTTHRSRKPAPRKRAVRTRKHPVAGKTAMPQHFRKKIEQNILFTGVSMKPLAKTVAGLSVQTFRAGDEIFDEYSKGRDLYLILNGRVRIKKQTKFGVESLLAVLHETDFFGELSIIDGLPPVCTCGGHGRLHRRGSPGPRFPPARRPEHRVHS